MNKTSKNNILIIGVSDISIYILESLLNCNKNYNITLICDQKISEKKLIEVKKFSNLINIIPEILPESNIFKSKEYANNLEAERICPTFHSSELNAIFFETLIETGCYYDPLSILR